MICPVYLFLFVLQLYLLTLDCQKFEVEVNFARAFKIFVSLTTLRREDPFVSNRGSGDTLRRNPSPAGEKRPAYRKEGISPGCCHEPGRMPRKGHSSRLLAKTGTNAPSL